MQKVLMSSAKDSWETPQSLYEELDRVFHFSMDAAASGENHKCPLYLTEATNALEVDWKFTLEINHAQTNTVFLNPPYGQRLLLPFFQKVRQEYNKGLTIVVLAAARTETKWHQITWDHARYVLFLNKRLRFELDGVPQGTATFPSEIMVFSQRKWNLYPLMHLGKLIEQSIISNEELQTIL